MWIQSLKALKDPACDEWTVRKDLLWQDVTTFFNQFNQYIDNDVRAQLFQLRQDIEQLKINILLAENLETVSRLRSQFQTLAKSIKINKKHVVPMTSKNPFFEEVTKRVEDKFRQLKMNMDWNGQLIGSIMPYVQQWDDMKHIDPVYMDGTLTASLQAWSNNVVQHLKVNNFYHAREQQINLTYQFLTWFYNTYKGTMDKLAEEGLTKVQAPFVWPAYVQPSPSNELWLALSAIQHSLKGNAMPFWERMTLEVFINYMEGPPDSEHSLKTIVVQNAIKRWQSIDPQLMQPRLHLSVLHVLVQRYNSRRVKWDPKYIFQTQGTQLTLRVVIQSSSVYPSPTRCPSCDRKHLPD
jgi:hypothetical protein